MTASATDAPLASQGRRLAGAVLDISLFVLRSLLPPPPPISWGSTVMRRSLLLGLALLLAAVLFSQPTGPAAAQGVSIPILVSNLEQTPSSVPGNLASDRAQGFTTGGHSAGYTLTSVDFPFRNLSHATIFSSGLTAEIQTASGSVLATLTNPAYVATTSERNYRFTAPGGSLQLAANTTYYFVLDVHQDIPAANADWRGTTSDGEDATGQSDWTIDDNSLLRSRTATDIASYGASTNSLRIRLNGAEATANAVGSYTVPHDWALKPSGLNPGDEFRLLIITADQTAVTATDIATYDAFVQASAAGSHAGGAHDAIKPYSSLFKVVGSTASVDARDHVGASRFNSSHKDVPIYWLNGSRVAANTAGFWSSTWESFARTDRRGAAGAEPTFAQGDRPWTGTLAAGTKDPGYELGSANPRRGKWKDTIADTGPLDGTPRITFANTNQEPVYGISPVFRVGNPPGYSVTVSWDDGTSTAPTAIDEGLSSYNGGPTIRLTFTLNQNAPAGGIDLGRIVAGNNLVNGELPSNPVAKIPAGQQSVSYQITSTSDGIDTVGVRTLSYAYPNDPGFTLTPSDGALTLSILDGDPTGVELTTPPRSFTVVEGTVIKFRVTLERPLSAGEELTVPLSVTGASDQVNDYGLALTSGAANTGVSLNTGAPAQPVLTFSGARARTAELDFTLKKDGTAESGVETITVGLETSSAIRLGSGRSFTVKVADALPWIQFRTCRDANCSGTNTETSAGDPPPQLTLHEGGAQVAVQWRLRDPLNRSFERKTVQPLPANTWGGHKEGSRRIGAGTVDNDRLRCDEPTTGTRNREVGVGNPLPGHSDIDKRNYCPFDTVFVYPHTKDRWQTVKLTAGEDGDAFDHLTHLIFDPRVAVSGPGAPGYGEWDDADFNYQSVWLPVKIVDDDQWDQDVAISTDGGTTWTTIAQGGLSGAFPASLTSGADHTFMMRLVGINPADGAISSTPATGEERVYIGTETDPVHQVLLFSSADATGATHTGAGDTDVFGMVLNHANPVTMTIRVPEGFYGDVRFKIESRKLYGRTDTAVQRSGGVRVGPFPFYREIISCVGCQRSAAADEPLPPPVVGEVGDLTAANLSDGGIRISWPRVTGAEGYQVRYWSTTSPFPGVPAEEAYYGAVVRETSYDIGGLDPSTEYRAVVYYIDHGEVQLSTASPALRFTTLASGAATQANPASPTLERVPKASVSANSPVIGEGEDAVFTVTLSPAPAAPTPVKIAVRNHHIGGLAVETGQLGERTVTVPTGGSVTVTVPTYNDNNPNPNAPLYVDVVSGDGYKVSLFESRAVVIIENDDAPVPVTTIAVKRVTGDTATVIWAPKPGDTSYQVGWYSLGSNPELNWDTTTGTEYRITGLDPESAYQVVVIGQHGSSIGGTYSVQVTTLASGQSQDFGVTVAQPPTDPEVSVTAGGDVTEGGDAVFTVTASPAPKADLRVAVSVSASGDYGAATGRQAVTIPTGGSATLTVSTTDDDLNEADGSVTATVDDDHGYTVSSTQGSATINVADDDGPELSIAGGPGITEGGTASFTISADPVPAEPITVNVGVSQSGDFGATGAVKVQVSGATTTYTITTIDDDADEGDGSVTATLEDGSGYTVSSANGAATVDVSDNDDAPSGYTVDPDVVAAVRELASQSEHGPQHVNRWQRVLVAFGELDAAGVDGGAMTAAQAQDMADTHSSPVWDDVVDELTKLEAWRAAQGPDDDDNQPPPTPEVSISGGSGITEGGTASFTITASPAPASPLTVKVGVSENGSFGASGAVTITVSGASTTYTISTTDDNVDEADGSVTATLQDGSGYTVSSSQGAASVNVADNDVPELSISGGSGITEGGTASFTITASPAPASPLTVKVGVSENGSFGASGAVTITVSGASTTYTISTTDDNVDEADGSVTATLQDGTGYTVSSSNGAATVNVADDDVPELSISGGSGITEGGTASFTIMASPAPASPITVKVGVSQNGDFGASGAATITVSGATTTYTIATTDDNADEADGSVTATLKDGTGYTVSSTQGAATVDVADDDDAPVVTPVLSISGGSGITEGGTASFTITASPAPASPITVKVGVSENGDFGASGAATVTVSGASTTYTISTTDDNVDEADGSVTATLKDGTGYTVSSSNGAATVSVADDDDAPKPVVEISVSVEDASATEGEELTFTVRLSEASTEEITVTWNTATAWDEDNRAHGGADYQEEFYSELVFAPGVTEMTGKVWLEEDAKAEEDEHFVVEVFLPGTIWPPDAVGTMTIIDDD